MKMNLSPFRLNQHWLIKSSDPLAEVAVVNQEMQNCLTLLRFVDSRRAALEFVGDR